MVGFMISNDVIRDFCLSSSLFFLLFPFLCSTYSGPSVSLNYTSPCFVSILNAEGVRLFGSLYDWEYEIKLYKEKVVLYFQKRDGRQAKLKGKKIYYKGKSHKDCAQGGTDVCKSCFWRRVEKIQCQSLVLLSEVIHLEARAELFRLGQGEKEGHFVSSTVNKFSTEGTSNNYFRISVWKKG